VIDKKYESKKDYELNSPAIYGWENRPVGNAYSVYGVIL